MNNCNMKIILKKQLEIRGSIFNDGCNIFVKKTISKTKFIGDVGITAYPFIIKNCIIDKEYEEAGPGYDHVNKYIKIHKGEGIYKLPDELDGVETNQGVPVFYNKDNKPYMIACKQHFNKYDDSNKLSKWWYELHIIDGETSKIVCTINSEKFDKEMKSKGYNSEFNNYHHFDTINSLFFNNDKTHLYTRYNIGPGLRMAAVLTADGNTFDFKDPKLIKIQSDKYKYCYSITYVYDKYFIALIYDDFIAKPHYYFNEEAICILEMIDVDNFIIKDVIVTSKRTRYKYRYWDIYPDTKNGLFWIGIDKGNKLLEFKIKT